LRPVVCMSRKESRARRLLDRAELQKVPSHGRHCHSTLPVTVIGCHSLEIYAVIVLPLLFLFAKDGVVPRG
jgi:hypothetical protein